MNYVERDEGFMNYRFITKNEEDVGHVGRNIGILALMGAFLICIVGMMVSSGGDDIPMGLFILFPLLPIVVGGLSTWFMYKKGKNALEKRNEIMDRGLMTLGYVKRIKEVTIGGRNNRERCLKYTVVYDLENGEGQREWESPYYRKIHNGVIRENGFCKLHVYNNEVCLDEDQTREIPVFGESSNYWRHY